MIGTTDRCEAGARPHRRRVVHGHTRCAKNWTF